MNEEHSNLLCGDCFNRNKRDILMERSEDKSATVAWFTCPQCGLKVAVSKPARFIGEVRYQSGSFLREGYKKEVSK